MGVKTSDSESINKRRGPKRRLAATGLLLAVVGAFSTTTLGMDWYKLNLDNYTILDFTGNSYSEVGVTQGFTITEIVNSEPTPVIDSMGKELVEQKPVSSIFGLPKTVTWYFLAIVLIVLGSSFSSVVFIASGTIGLLFSWRELISMRNIIENPYFGGDLSIPAAGLSNYQLALMCSIVLSLSCLVQSALILINKRKEERKKAVENGEEITPSLLESLTGLISVGQNYRRESSIAKSKTSV